MRADKTGGRYTIILNKPLEDARLSLRAKGLLAYALSRPDDWEICTSHLVTTCKDGRDSIYSTISELEQFGYITRSKATENNGRFAGVDYMVHESPLPESPDTAKPDTVNPPPITTDGNNTDSNNTPSSPPAGDASEFPLKEILAMWEQKLPELPQPRKFSLTDQRRRQLRSFWERFERNMTMIGEIFDLVAESDFLCGKTGAWRADLWWCITPEHSARIVEGRYDNRTDKPHSPYRR